MKTNQKQTTHKDCSCDKFYDTSDASFQTYYKGYPGLVRFMEEKNTDMFYEMT